MNGKKTESRVVKNGKLGVGCVITACVLALYVLYCGEAYGQKFTFQAGSAVAREAPVGQALEKFAEAVEKETKGEVKIRVVHSSALGSLLDMNDQLRTGALAMTTFVPSTKATEDKFFMVDELPYLWKDMDQDLNACHGDLGKLYKEHASKLGIHIIGFEASVQD